MEKEVCGGGWGCSQYRHCGGVKPAELGREQRKEFSCEAVTTKTSASPPGSSGAGMILQNCPTVGEVAGALFSQTDQSLAVG